MVEPIVLPRAEHTLSRRDIDPDALKVTSRLQELGFTAYLVGGGVRDLLLGRRPKDFDIGTSAPPHQIKRAFRNCWIIGRRFRLAHVKFGTKTIEVATFRRNVRADAEPEPEPTPGLLHGQAADAVVAADGGPTPDRLIQRDNVYGTPEEDAFRRDFTVNALFYNSADRTIIDYVGGLQDLDARVIRSIGDPMERFQEDPVRMLRALVLAERLNFTLDDLVVRAIEEIGSHIRLSAPARLMEEYFKILRSGAAEGAFQGLARAGLIEHISPEMEEGLSPEFFESLARLDAWRRRFAETPDTLTTTILVGSLLVPLGLMDEATRRFGVSEQWYPALGRLPVPRKDVERLVQLLSILPKMRDIAQASRTQHALVHRGIFRDALTWLEIYGDDPDVVAHWRAALDEHPTAGQPHRNGPSGNGQPGPNGPNGPFPSSPATGDALRPRRRRRRRRSHVRPPAL
jgi:poly(A) polymerase